MKFGLPPVRLVADFRASAMGIKPKSPGSVATVSIIAGNGRSGVSATSDLRASDGTFVASITVSRPKASRSPAMDRGTSNADNRPYGLGGCLPQIVCQCDSSRPMLISRP